ncbi:TMhelix containing protein [Vibrio phage 1.063.O._10N.261.45.C7]|nr:TMhelix containing protein [Vibrio phage 1.063.O._10N.261.45.C7]
MVTLGVFWIKHHYKGNDCDGFIYWGTCIVDVVMIINLF